MEPRGRVPRAVRAMVGFALVVQVVIAIGALVGGVVQLVSGLSGPDWAGVAAGVVGLLLGGAFAAMAYGQWTARGSDGAGSSD